MESNSSQSRSSHLKELGVPLHYRLRFINWLTAEPWRLVGSKRWRYGTMYRANLDEHHFNLPSGREYHDPSYGRLRSAWLALTFPHIHHHLED